MTAARRIKTEVEGEDAQQSLVSVVAAAGTDVSHNLNGQKLGRKGRGTRERILTATAELLADHDDEAVSMSAVARKASLGMTSLYNYFTDFTELLLAVLEPVIAESEAAFLGMLREYWPDEVLGERCYAFMLAYHAFWARNSRLLHLRNSMADARDERMRIHRVKVARPIIALLAEQMDSAEGGVVSRDMATVLMTGIERTVTVATDLQYTTLFGVDERREADHYLRPEARLMELAIRDTRQQVARLRAEG